MSASHITTAISNLEIKIAEATENPKPSYDIDGQSVDYNAYYEMLWKQLRMAKEQLALTENYEISERAYTT